MKSRFALFGLLFLALALVVALPGAMAGDGPAGDVGDGLGFGLKVAGTYMDMGELPDVPTSWIGAQTLSADGTVVTTNTNCCGQAGNIQTPGFGAWERTGIRQVTLTALIFVQNLDGTDFLIGKPTIVLDFDDDFETATGVINTELFLSFQDPLTDDPIACVQGTDNFRRLHVDTLCSLD